MPDTKVSALTALTGANIASNDIFPLVDVSDTTMAASGTTKKTTRADLQTYVGGTVVADTPTLNLTQTWNSGGVTFTGIKANFTDTASANASMPLDIQVSSASIMKLEKSNATSGGTALVLTAATPNTQTVIITPRDGSTGACSIRGAGSYYFDGPVGIGNPDTAITRASANSFVFGSFPSAGSATTRTEIAKSVTAIANNTATAVLTFTVPNAAHSASFLVELVGSSGAGGSVGANESTQSARYQVDIARTAGVNAVATIGAIFGQPAAVTVAGGNSVATTAALSAISGAVGATNTFTVNVTIARSAGTATNHTCLVNARLLNANASGVTVA